MTILAVLLVLGAFKLLDFSLIASLVVVEVPLAFIVARLLGEHRRNRLSEALDMWELAQKWSHLRVCSFPIVPRLGLGDYFIVVNWDTKKAFDCPKYVIEIANLGLVKKMRYKNEKHMRDDLALAAISLSTEEATIDDLKARQVVPS